MKKLSLYTLLSMLCMFMASCDEDFENWAEPQSWPQEEAVTVPGFSVSSTGSTINLKDVKTDSVKILSIDNSANLEIDSIRITLKPADKSDADSVLFATDTTGNVSVAKLAKLVEDVYGKRPVERTFVGKAVADAMFGGQAMLINAGQIKVVAVPEAPVIEQNYYLCGDMCDWNTENALKFVHSDKDVYEDPIFTLVFETSKDDSYWKVLIANAEGVVGWDGQIGVAENGDASFTGKLVQKVGDMPDPGAGRIEKTGKYIMTLNMMDGTYEIKPLVSQYFYLVGALQGWNSNADEGKTCIFYPNSSTQFTYTTKWEGDGNFKFWTGADFGNWDLAYGTEVDMSRELKGSLKVNGGAIAVPEQNMFYTVTIDIATMSYEWTKLDEQNPKSFEKLGLIGGFNDWSADAEMTQSAPHNWFAQIKLDTDTELKIRANGDWADNWGAEDGLDITTNNYFNSKYNGGNIKVPAGDYTIFFNDITGKMVFIKK